MHLHYHYLNVKPSRELMEFYNEIVEASKNVEFNLESSCRQLYQNSRERSAFVCDFAVFKEIFNLQIRNIERLGTTMFLAVITVSGTDGGQMESIRQENVMRGLMEILRNNLREGDVITHSPRRRLRCCADGGLQHGLRRDGIASKAANSIRRIPTPTCCSTTALRR